ncbi:hypothetical protein SAMN05443575_3808 [Jatrophihabitans endophyticus]|uniref:Uncharacterized protein n=1 Tax=Jatrophihabitans endophyticus TaxID=1206085 RepID=A0A1M5SST3_9ACTN|nr:hypothetical protein [Jatrophihabitans endophyticus]SHH41601.1 hypothetical protein SAMN05443575_3808 [Jatrophihabitans endophyticus]
MTATVIRVLVAVQVVLGVVATALSGFAVVLWLVWFTGGRFDGDGVVLVLLGVTSALATVVVGGAGHRAGAGDRGMVVTLAVAELVLGLGLVALLTVTGISGALGPLGLVPLLDLLCCVGVLVGCARALQQGAAELDA